MSHRCSMQMLRPYRWRQTTHVWGLRVGMRTCVLTPVHPSAEVAETGDPRSLKASLTKAVSTRLSERPRLKTYSRKHQGRDGINLWPHTRVHTSACTLHMPQGTSWRQEAESDGLSLQTEISSRRLCWLEGDCESGIARRVPAPKQQTHRRRLPAHGALALPFPVYPQPVTSFPSPRPSVYYNSLDNSPNHTECLCIKLGPWILRARRQS